jgi:hypothetical protein
MKETIDCLLPAYVTTLYIGCLELSGGLTQPGKLVVERAGRVDTTGRAELSEPGELSSERAGRVDSTGRAELSEIAREFETTQQTTHSLPYKYMYNTKRKEKN